MSTIPAIYPDSISHTPVSESIQLITLPDSLLSVYTENLPTIKAEQIPFSTFSNSWISLLIVICFLFVTSSYQASNHFLKTLFSEIFEEKQRHRSFQKSTLAAVRLKVAFLVMTFVIEGLALYVVFEKMSSSRITPISSLLIVGGFAILFSLLYIIWFLFGNFIGFVFSEKNKTSIWLSSLTNIIILRGLALFIPVLVAIYHPIPLNTFITVTVSVYLATRLLFIFSGIKIFFSDFYSLIYGVLYLCTLEIAPLLAIYKGIFILFRFVELKLF